MSSVNMRILHELEVDHAVSEDVMQLLQDKFSSVEYIFTGLSTAHQQDKYFKEKFHKIVSMLTRRI